MAAPNKPTLVQAVEAVVQNEFVAIFKKFSAYDITQRLRELVDISSPSLPNIDPNETGTVYVHGRRIPRIDHEDVKDTVHDLYERKLMPNYFRVHAGTYFEYEYAPPDPLAGSDGGSYDGSSTL